MFALRHLIEALATILNLALTIYMWVIIARALLSDPRLLVLDEAHDHLGEAVERVGGEAGAGAQGADREVRPEDVAGAVDEIEGLLLLRRHGVIRVAS